MRKGVPFFQKQSRLPKKGVCAPNHVAGGHCHDLLLMPSVKLCASPGFLICTGDSLAGQWAFLQDVPRNPTPEIDAKLPGNLKRGLGQRPGDDPSF